MENALTDALQALVDVHGYDEVRKRLLFIGIALHAEAHLAEMRVLNSPPFGTARAADRSIGLRTDDPDPNMDGR